MSDFDKDMARVHDLRQAAKAYEAEAAEILARYTWDEERAYPAGNFIAQVSRTRRFDPAIAKKVLTPEEYTSTLVTKPDSAAAKKALDPERYRAAQREYGYTVRIEPVTDDE